MLHQQKKHHVIKLDTLHHSNQLFVIANDSHTRMLSHHVCSPIPYTDFNEVQLLLLEDPVAHEMVFGQDLFRASVVHRIVDDVQGRLAVHEQDLSSGICCAGNFSHLR